MLFLQISCFSVSIGKILKSDPHLPEKKIICFNDSPLQVMENTFYFLFKSSFRSQDLFGHVQKNGLIRKIGLLSKFLVMYKKMV